MFIGSTGLFARSTASTQRIKKEIQLLDVEQYAELNPEALYDVNVVTYKFKDEILPEDDYRYDKPVIGLIAEDIYEKYPIAADYYDDDVQDWNGRYMIPAMLKLLQDQKKVIESLQQRLDNAGI